VIDRDTVLKLMNESAAVYLVTVHGATPRIAPWSI